MSIDVLIIEYILNVILELCLSVIFCEQIFGKKKKY